MYGRWLGVGVLVIALGGCCGSVCASGDEIADDFGEAPKPVAPRLDAAELRQALLRDLGCQEGNITAEGCAQCEGQWAGDLNEDSSVILSDLHQGLFGPDDRLRAIVSASGCSTRAAGESEQIIAVLTDGTWSVERREPFNDVMRCEELAASDGHRHLLCVASTPYSTALYTPNTLRYRLDSPHLPAEQRGEAVESVSLISFEPGEGEYTEEEGWVDQPTLTLQIEDADGDGDDDAVITASTGERFTLTQGEQRLVVAPR